MDKKFVDDINRAHSEYKISEWLKESSFKRNPATFTARILDKATGTFIGAIKLKKTMRKYCFFTGSGVVFTGQCHLDISSLLAKLNDRTDVT